MKHLKQEFDKLTFKETTTFFIAIISLIAGFVLAFCGMFIPPEGEIHESVIASFGTILLFVGSLLGIEMRYADKTRELKKFISDYLANAKAENDKTV